MPSGTHLAVPISFIRWFGLEQDSRGVGQSSTRGGRLLRWLHGIPRTQCRCRFHHEPKRNGFAPRPVWQRRTCQRVLFYRHRIGQRSPSLTTPPLPMDEEGTTATASSSCPSPGLAKPRLCFRAILGWFQPLARLQQRGYSDGRSLLACVRARVEQSTDATWQRTCGWRKKRSRTPEKCPLQASASENFRGCRSRALTETTAEQLVAKAREP